MTSARCRIAALSLFAGLTALITAQDERELLADGSAWRSHEVGVGVTLRQRWFERLFGAPQSLSVLEIRPGPRVRFDLEAPGRRRLTSVMGREHGALAAINGGFFDIHKTGASLGLLRLDGALVVPANPEQGSVGIDAARRLQLATRPAGDWPEMHEALGAGPMLLRAGAPLAHAGERDPRHPRSAIGVTADARVLWLAADGRTAQAAGLTLAETTTVLQALGCTDALNLDGGGSTTLWVAGRGVCNFPCDNKRYDHEGERAVANALLVFAPAIVVVDDAAAELRGSGWQRVAATDGVHDGGFAASTAADARAVFRVELPFAGRWRLLVSQPRATDPVQIDVYGGAELAGPAALGDFGSVGEIDVRSGLPTWLTVRAVAGAVVVDAVRFEQIVE